MQLTTSPVVNRSKPRHCSLDATNQPIQLGDAMRVIPPKYAPHSQAAPRIYLSQSPLNFRRPLDGLASKLRDPRYHFLFRPGDWFPDLDGQPQLDLDALLEEWLGGQQPISILDLSGVPTPILAELVA